jgi:hypothetical protein
MIINQFFFKERHLSECEPVFSYSLEHFVTLSDLGNSIN